MNRKTQYGQQMELGLDSLCLGCRGTEANTLQPPVQVTASCLFSLPTSARSTDRGIEDHVFMVVHELLALPLKSLCNIIESLLVL